jgi:hypothetical protein
MSAKPTTRKAWLAYLQKAVDEFDWSAVEQEPVKIVQYNCTCGRTMKFESEHGVVAPQREWQGLTDEEIDELHGSPMSLEHSGELKWVRIIEAKLKEKNNA